MARSYKESRGCDHCGWPDGIDIDPSDPTDQLIASHGWSQVALLFAADGKPQQLTQDLCPSCTADISSWLATREDTK